MKLIGLLGGINGWRTTATYYRLMNEYVRKQLGNDHTARILLHSVDYQHINQWRASDDWDAIGSLLAEAARGLNAGGAEFIVLAGNSIHKSTDHINAASGLDLLHIADPVGSEIVRDGYRKVGLLGTRATMETDIYEKRLQQTYGISMIVPDPVDRIELDRIIFDELSLGVIRTELQAYVCGLIRQLRDRGAEAIILGCPELTVLAPPDNNILPVYDTTRLHATAAVMRAIEKTHART